MAEEFKDPVATTIKDLGDQFSAIKEELGKLSGTGAPAPAHEDPVEEVKKEFSSIFKKLHASLNGIQGVQSSGVSGVQSAEPPQGTATIDNKGVKIKLDPETIEALTGDRKGFKGRKERVKKTKRELTGLSELSHETAGASAADALLNKRKGLTGAAGAAARFTVQKAKQSFIEKFDPLRAIHRATGGSKIATALAGKAMFRSEKSIREISGMERRSGLPGTSANRSGGAGDAGGSGSGSQSPVSVSSGAEEGGAPILVRIAKRVDNIGATLMRMAERAGVATKHLEELDESNQELLVEQEKLTDAAKVQEAGKEQESGPIVKEGGLGGLLKGFDLGKLFDKIFDMVLNKGVSLIIKSLMKYLPLIILGLTAVWVAFTADWKKMWNDLMFIWEDWTKDIGNWFGEMWAGIKQIWTDMTDPVVKVFQDLVGGITSKVEALWETIKPFWETLVGAIEQVTGAIMGKVNSVLEFLGIKAKPVPGASPTVPVLPNSVPGASPTVPVLPNSVPQNQGNPVAAPPAGSPQMVVSEATPKKEPSPQMVVSEATPKKEPWGGPETVARVAEAFSRISGSRVGPESGQSLQQAHDNKESSSASPVGAVVNNTNANKTTHVTNNNTSLSGVMASPRNTESSFMRAMNKASAY